MTTSELATFQDRFAAALAGEPADLSPWLGALTPTAAEAGLSVHRNTVAKGRIDALADRFPTVERTVGADWFAAAALDFARAHPPERAHLAAWGEDFPAWLADFPPAADLAYLPALARLDGLWMEAYLAADAPALDADAFARLGSEGPGRIRAVLHPSARPAWFDDGAAALWRLIRPPAEPPARIALSPEPGGLLIVRPEMTVESHALTRAGFILLTACAAGASLAAAAEAALQAEPDAALAEIFADLIQAGAFSDLVPFAP